MIAKHGKLIIGMAALFFAIAGILFMANILKWNCIPIKISDNINSWSAFGDYIGGLVGVFFGFLTILILVVSEMERNKSDKIREDVSAINDAIKQNREIFNSIKKYDDSDLSGQTQSEVEKSGPEAFKIMYKKVFANRYETTFQEYIKKVEIDFNSLYRDDKATDRLLEICKDEWREKHKPTRAETMKSSVDAFRKLEDSTRGVFSETKNPVDNIKEFERRMKEEFQGFSMNKMLLGQGSSAWANILDPQLIVKIIRDAFKLFYQIDGHLFGHYFRNQYYLFETIEKSGLDVEQKEAMFKSYRSHLSAYELVIMFYNSLSEYSSKENNFFLSRFDLLKDLEIVKFIHNEFYDKYRPKKKGERNRLIEIADALNAKNSSMAMANPS